MKLRIFALVLCFVLLLAALMSPGCSGYNFTPQEAAAPVSQAVTEADPQAALEEIYYDVQIMGVQEATPALLEERFNLDRSLYTSVDARFADGRFGVADVYIFRPTPGKEDELKEALEQIKLSRILEFKNYDIYNSAQLSEDGLIYTRGEYMILTMIENAEKVREIIEKYIPNK